MRYTALLPLSFRLKHSTHSLDKHFRLFAEPQVETTLKGMSLAPSTLALKMKLFTVYSSPEHPDGVVHVTKADALAHPEE